MNKALQLRKDLSYPKAFHKDAILENFGKNLLEVIELSILFHTKLPSHLVLHLNGEIIWRPNCLLYNFYSGLWSYKNKPNPLST